MTQVDTRLDLDDALRAILNDTRSMTATAVVELNAAVGRVLAGDLTAPLSLPPFPASAMDGYALRSDDAKGSPPYRFSVAGTSFAGRPLTGAIPTGACVRIFTGAPVPEQLDTVVIQEECESDGAAVVVNCPIEAGAHVRPVGHDVEAGARLMTGGRLLSAFDVGWLAACGMTDATVRKRPTVGLFSNGDELAEPGQQLAPGQIYDANRVALRALLQRLPVHVHDYGVVADDPAELRDVLQQADADCDLIITSGGVSVGEADWVKDAVGALGTVQLWRLNLKPGKPLAYGRLRKAAFFGLPGNPVSALVTTLMLVQPTLQRLCGAEPIPPLAVPALLRGSLRHQPGREEFQRGTLVDCGGSLEVTVTGDQSSNRLSSFAAANCLIRIPKNCGDLSDGARVTALPFRGLL